MITFETKEVLFWGLNEQVILPLIENALLGFILYFVIKNFVEKKSAVALTEFFVGVLLFFKQLYDWGIIEI